MFRLHRFCYDQQLMQCFAINWNIFTVFTAMYCASCWSQQNHCSHNHQLMQCFAINWNIFTVFTAMYCATRWSQQNHCSLNKPLQSNRVFSFTVIGFRSENVLHRLAEALLRSERLVPFRDQRLKHFSLRLRLSVA